MNYVRIMLLGIVIGSCCLIVVGSILQVRMIQEQVIAARLLWSQQETGVWRFGITICRFQPGLSIT